MERVNIRQQNLDELYQTPENTLESTHPPLFFVLGQADPVVEVSPHSSFPTWHLLQLSNKVRRIRILRPMVCSLIPMLCYLRTLVLVTHYLGVGRKMYTDYEIICGDPPHLRFP